MPESQMFGRLDQIKGIENLMKFVDIIVSQYF